jgi:hypothetical protein
MTQNKEWYNMFRIHKRCATRRTQSILCGGVKKQNCSASQNRGPYPILRFWASPPILHSSPHHVLWSWRRWVNSYYKLQRRQSSRYLYAYLRIEPNGSRRIRSNDISKKRLVCLTISTPLKLSKDAISHSCPHVLWCNSPFKIKDPSFKPLLLLMKGPGEPERHPSLLRIAPPWLDPLTPTLIDCEEHSSSIHRQKHQRHHSSSIFVRADFAISPLVWTQ